MDDVTDLMTWLRAQLDHDEGALYLAGATGERWPYPGFRWLIQDIDAKRDIIDACESNAEDGSTSGAILAKTILPLLALPYAARPGYREEWRP